MRNAVTAGIQVARHEVECGECLVTRFAPSMSSPEVVAVSGKSEKQLLASQVNNDWLFGLTNFTPKCRNVEQHDGGSSSDDGITRCHPIQSFGG